MNSEGYKDPTAEKAIHNAGYLPEHIWEPLKLIRRLLDIVGLELIGITVRDRKSKRKYSWSSWGGDTVAGDDGKRKEKGIPEKVPESGKKGTGNPGRDTKTPGR